MAEFILILSGFLAKKPKTAQKTEANEAAEKSIEKRCFKNRKFK